MTVNDFLQLNLFWTALEYAAAKMMFRGMNKEGYLVADEGRGLMRGPLTTVDNGGIKYVMKFLVNVLCNRAVIGID